MEKLYTVSKNKTGNSLWLTSSASQSKFRLNLNKPGKTTKPVRYNLNQVPYEYVMEVMNRFKGLFLVDRVPKKLWTEVSNTVQEAMIKTIPKKKKCKKTEWLSEELYR